MEKLDIFIPHIAHNNELLYINLPYIQKNLNPKNIYIVASHKTLEDIQSLACENVFLIDEDTVFEGLTLNAVKALMQKMALPIERTGWYFQQFLKLGWAANTIGSDWYITWDSDTIPIRKVSFFSDTGKPLFIKKKEFNKAYFETIEKILNLKKNNDFSFIAESMLFNKNLVRSMLKEIEDNSYLKGNSFYKRILYAVMGNSLPSSGFSEFETYGTYVTFHFPEIYDFKESNGFRNGAKYFGLKPSIYDLKRFSQKYDIVSFERWNTIFKPFITLQKIYSFFICKIKNL